MSTTPYPKNAPGSFYVENQCCMTCEAPDHEAKDLMAHDEEDGYHCYFKKQPETPEEVERAILACAVSCVRAVRYAGHDPAILDRFRELRSEDSCDVFDDLNLEDPRAPLLPPTDHPHPLWDRDLDG